MRHHWRPHQTSASSSTHTTGDCWGEHRLDNGVLLRSDVHTLFDRGYLSVDPRHRLAVSPRLRDEFFNGDEFYDRQGIRIEVPSRRLDRPHKDFLEWHRDERFLAS